MIEAEGLKKTFDGKLIFEDLSFQIPDGQFVGVYGRSGVGKSTLAKVLCGMTCPDGGHVSLDGVPLWDGRGRYDRKTGLRIQMVYQQPYSALDGSQKLGVGLRELIRCHRFVSGREETERLIGTLMAQVGLDMDILDHLPRQISGGEAQRVSIARCLLFRPRLLILDEATSMLDVSTQANVMALVRRVMAKNNGSVMLISHDWELVEHLCGRIYVFDGYRLKERSEL